MLERSRVSSPEALVSFQPCILIIGGGVPKNFVQDTVVGAETLGYKVPMHKYAIQITVADVRDGALSSSTLKEASSWGKTDYYGGGTQMVYGEVTALWPLLASRAYRSGAWKNRKPREFGKWLDSLKGPRDFGKKKIVGRKIKAA